MAQIVLGPNRAYPSLPTVGNDLDSHSRALEAIIESLQIHERRTKNVFDSFVRVSELQTLGLIDVDGNVVVDTNVEESTTHHHDSRYLLLDGSNDPVTGLVNFDAGLTAAGATITGAMDVTGATITGLSSDDLSDVASIAMLDENENITGNWSHRAGAVDFYYAPNDTNYFSLSHSGSAALFYSDVYGFTFGVAAATPMSMDASGVYTGVTLYANQGARLPNSVYLQGQNLAATAYYDLIGVNASDWIEFGDPSRNVQYDGALHKFSSVTEHHADVKLMSGGDLIVYDTTNTDYAQFAHDGVDFNTTFANTTDWNVDDIVFKLNSTLSVQNPLKTGSLSLYTSVDNHSTLLGTGHIYLSPGTSGNDVLIFRSGYVAGLRMYDSTGADYARFHHDGTDFNTTFANTTDWNISGITAIQAGAVDADFDAITATSYGGILEANLLDKTAAETVTGSYHFSPRTYFDAGINVDGANTNIMNGTGLSLFNTGNTVYLTAVQGTTSHSWTWSASDMIWNISNLGQMNVVGGAGRELALLNNFAFIPKGYIKYSSVDFRFDASDTAWIGDTGATISVTTGTSPSSTALKALFGYTNSYINLNTYKDVSNNFTIEVTGISISNSSNTRWKPYVLFHSGGGSAGNLKIDFLEGDGTTWTTVYNAAAKDVINPTDYVTFATGILKGMRFIFTGITANTYLKMIGATSITSPSFQWQMLRSGSEVYGTISGKADNVLGYTLSATGDFINYTGAQYMRGGNYWAQTTNPAYYLQHQQTGTIAGLLQDSSRNLIIRPDTAVATKDLTYSVGNARWEFDTDIRAAQDVRVAGLTIYDDTATTKETLYTGYNLGIEASTMWWQVPPSSNFRWYTSTPDAGASDVFEINANDATANVNVKLYGGHALQIYDSTGADYASFSHDGTYFNTTFAGTTAWRINDDVQLISGADLFIYDAGTTDYAQFAHDGVDFNTTFVNTADWNIFGPLRIEKLKYQAGAASDDEATQFVWYWPDSTTNSNTWYKVCDVSLSSGAYRGLAMAVDLTWSNDNYGAGFDHRTSRYYISFHRSNATPDTPDNAVVVGVDPGSAALRVYKTATGSYELQVQTSGNYDSIMCEVMVQGSNGGTVTPTAGTVLGTNAGGTAYTPVAGTSSTVDPEIVAGMRFRTPLLQVFDSGNTDYAQFDHDGTDFNTAFTNTTDWNITGANIALTGSLAATGAVTGSNLNVSNWDTAYGWGDHSVQNYFDKDSDQTYANVVTLSKDGAPSIIFDPSANNGPVGLRWSMGVSTAEDVDLVYRSTPNQLIFERVSDGADILYVDPATLTVYANNIALDGPIDKLSGDMSFEIAGVEKFVIKSTGSVEVHDGFVLRIYNSTDTDYVHFVHDGTDFSMVGANTDWIRTTGLSQGFWVSNGGILRVSNAGNTDWGQMYHDGTDFNLVMTNTTDWNVAGADIVNANGGLYVSAPSNPGIDTYKVNRFWQGYVTTTDVGTVPENYSAVYNLGTSTGTTPARGIQLAAAYGSNNNGFYIRRGSDNASSENGANVWQNWKQIMTKEYADTLYAAAGGNYLTTSTNFGGDVSGTYNAIVVANDSHTHAFDNLTGKTAGTGDYSTNGDLVSGRGSGGVALTINDGKGNANVTFNHQNGIPEQAGNAGRIEVNTDSTSGAYMSFELKSNVTTVSTDLTVPMILYEARLDLLAGTELRVYNSGSTDYLRIYHDGTDGQILAVNTADIRVGPYCDIHVDTLNSTGRVSSMLLKDHTATNQRYAGFIDSIVCRTNISFTAGAGDAGNVAVFDNTTNYTVTLAASSDLDFPVGCRLDILTNGSGTITINAGASTTLYWTGSGGAAFSTGSRTIQYGWATIWRRSTTQYYITGNGIS